MRSLMILIAWFSRGARLVWLVSLVLAALPAFAETYAERLNEARARLAADDPAAALEIYQEVLVEEPESEDTIFGIACARYQQAVQLFDAGNAEEAGEILVQAQEGFGDLSVSTRRALRANAAYNRANCVAVLAKRPPAPPEALGGMGAVDAPMDKKAYDEKVGALRGAVTAYERVTQEFPGHVDARRNLEHVRYLLKVQLQNPPEEPPTLFSVIMNAETDLPNAYVETTQEDTAVLKRGTKKGETL